MPRHAAQDEEIGESIDDIARIQSSRDPDRQCLAGEFVDDIQHPDLAAVMRAVLDKVIGPDMVGAFSTKPNARSLIQPKPSPLRLALRNFEPLCAPDARYAFLINGPACSMQEGCDAPIAVAAILPRQRDYIRCQSSFVISRLGNQTLCGAVLPDHPAGEPLRYTKGLNNMLDASPAARRA